MTNGMTPAQFVAKWAPVQLLESAASQEHFLDLCRLLGEPTPAEHDKTGEEYTFQKGVTVTGPASKGSQGQRGWADAWWRGKFGWEYKTKDKHPDLDDAYRQLCQYREALENPPLLVVSDITRTEIHTNFTGTAKKIHVVTLNDIAQPRGLAILRRVFSDPASFRPTVTPETVTQDVAGRFGDVASGLQRRGHDPHVAAHFLMKCIFCLFAEDVGLLPPKLFKHLVRQWASNPDELRERMSELFATMRTGGAFGVAAIPQFNGNLFDDEPALEITEQEAGVLILAANQDWANVEPAIFGTLFERSLDPDKRAQIGAHFTSREDIMLVIEPVVMAPLRREWQEVEARIDDQLSRRAKAKTKSTIRRAQRSIEKDLNEFLGRLSAITILDPACGSGNFLYVAIQQLLDFEKQVITYAARPDIAVGLLPNVRPSQLHGIEINPYASELAQMVIWIGYLQWMRTNGFNTPRDPILQPLNTIEERDAILDLSDAANPEAPDWPRVDFIIGNPPFAGRGKKRRLLTEHFGDAYADSLNGVYAGALAPGADLCCYWFEQARRQIARNSSVRVGLLATQGIRGGASRLALDRIKDTGDIFFAISDRRWILEGAVVHVSIIGFDDGSEQLRYLDGQQEESINANLTSGTDVTQARALRENRSLAFQGVIPMGPFDPPHEETMRMLRAGGNPNGIANSMVVKRWANGEDMLSSRGFDFTIDFFQMGMDEASAFELPFEYVRTHVLPAREAGDTEEAVDIYWLHWRPRPAMRRAMRQNCEQRFLATPRVSKYRLFLWMDIETVPSDATVVIARDDDYAFGVLQSSVHELWAIEAGTQLREQESGKRYSHTFTFVTFPFPWPLREPAIDHPCYQRIVQAAQQLDLERTRWLNPQEWIDPIARHVDATVDFSSVPDEARPLVRRATVMSRAARDDRLKQRTLTALYNERPTWLRVAHERLDRAVLAAYAAVDPDGGWAEEWAEVWVDTGAGELPDESPLEARRADIDQRVLAKLLRLNLERAHLEAQG